MTNEEITEMDAWIAEHVFGEEVIKETGRFGLFKVDVTLYSLKASGKGIPSYTTDPAAAMLVLEKCAEKVVTIEIHKTKDGYFVGELHGGGFAASTLPLAVCNFARRLFTTPNQEGK